MKRKMWIDVIVEIIQVFPCGTKACLLGSMFGTCFLYSTRPI